MLVVGCGPARVAKVKRPAAFFWKEFTMYRNGLLALFAGTAIAWCVILGVVWCAAPANGQTSTRTMFDARCERSGTCDAGTEDMDANGCTDILWLYCTGTCVRCSGAATGGLAFCVYSEGDSCGYYWPPMDVPCGQAIELACEELQGVPGDDPCICPSPDPLPAPSADPCAGSQCI